MIPSITRLVMGAGWVCSVGLALAQAPAGNAPTSLPLNDLSSFKAAGSNWRIAGDASADLVQNGALTATKGTGVLVNLPDKKSATDLQSTLQHGDLDLELDYMMAKGSNSGVYLQGRYEIQLTDSWGVKGARTGDNGSIYERWDESRPEGQKGYEGYAARQNASRAPGLWQHLKISFQAPRFDASGKKIENARMLRIELNGVPIHENVELTGPTRGAIANNETAVGPLVLQGDHGPVAFRNIHYVLYNKPRPELINLNYAVYKGRFQKEPDYKNTPPEAQGPLTQLSTGVTSIPNEFTIRYTGTLRVKEPGEYVFNLGPSGGGALMRINNAVVIKPGEGNLRGNATLPAGDLPFEMVYAKFVDWVKAGLGLAVAGPGVREYSMMAANEAGGEETDPILVDAPTNTILRSFMDLPNVKNDQGRTMRVVHAVSVGSPDGVHYTYDMDNGALVQVWRGQFLDTTPMWHDRGDGSSRPMGMVQRMGRPVLALRKLATPQTAWATDTAGTGYRPKGYVLDESDRPTFRYLAYGSQFNDQIRVIDNGQGIRREVTVTNPAGDLYARLVEGKTIEPLKNGLYCIDGKAYYVRIDEAGGATPIVRDANGGKELLVPVRNGKLSYSILF